MDRHVDTTVRLFTVGTEAGKRGPRPLRAARGAVRQEDDYLQTGTNHGVSMTPPCSRMKTTQETMEIPGRGERLAGYLRGLSALKCLFLKFR